MRNKTLVLALLSAFIVTGTLVACKESTAKKVNEERTPTPEEKAKRGEYLVASIGCDDCHSPKRMGPNGPELIPELRLSGYPSTRPIAKVDKSNLSNNWIMLGADLTSSVGPWGMSFAANLTSDETGLGNWTQAQFIKAIREGKWMGQDNTRPLLPPMPWFAYKNLTDDDLASIFAYLKTIPAVENVPPAPIAAADLK